MRVVSGELGGRKLSTPDGDDTRPTSERVREAIFNSLYSLDAIDEARVLDAFAGSGALGIEALSRGAAHATFVESAQPALRVIRENVASLDLDQVASIVPGQALTHLAGRPDYDLVLLDPPYGFDAWEALLDLVPAGAVVVIESDRAITVPVAWVVHRVKHYGSTVVTLATASDLRIQGEEAP